MTTKHFIERAKKEQPTAQQMLIAAGINFEKRQRGTHLIIRHCGHVVDFWPNPGIWIHHRSGRRERGIGPLIGFLNRLQPSE